jgi:threonine synthase
VAPVRPDTRVDALAMGDPPDGSDVLAAARASGGAVLAVDEDGLEGWAAVVEDATGIAVDLASAVAVAAAAEALERGVLDPDTRTVVVLTAGPPRRRPAPVGAEGAVVSIEPTRAALLAAVEEEPP